MKFCEVKQKKKKKDEEMDGVSASVSQSRHFFSLGHCWVEKSNTEVR